MIQVRAAAVADLPWLRHLFAGLVSEQFSHYPRVYPTFSVPEDLDVFTATCYRHLAYDQNFAAFVAWHPASKRAVGFIAGEIQTRAIGAPKRFGMAHWLYVHPDYRDQHLAGALIGAGMDWLRARGLDTLEFVGFDGDPLWPRHGAIPFLTHYMVPLGAREAEPLWEQATAPTFQKTGS